MGGRISALDNHALGMLELLMAMNLGAFVNLHINWLPEVSSHGFQLSQYDSMKKESTPFGCEPIASGGQARARKKASFGSKSSQSMEEHNGSCIDTRILHVADFVGINQPFWRVSDPQVIEALIPEIMRIGSPSDETIFHEEPN